MYDPSKYYMTRKNRLLLEFDLVAKSARTVVEGYFGENAQALTSEVRREFEDLIPQLPYVGGKQPFTEFIVFTGMLLAIYRVSKANGMTIEQTGVMVFEMGMAFLNSFPTFLLRLFVPVSFSRYAMEQMRKGSIESHRREYPESSVINFVEGNGVTFDYGVDYIECASYKFLAKQGAPEIAPYLCPVDILFSQALGWGLTRTTTLAEGAEVCDFRFKRGGPTNVAVPAALQDIVNRDLGS